MNGLGDDPTDSEGLGNIDPREATGLDPDDEGLGDIQLEDATGLELEDDGLGNVEIGEEAGPRDAGLGSVQPGGVPARARPRIGGSP